MVQHQGEGEWTKLLGGKKGVHKESSHMSLNFIILYYHFPIYLEIYRGGDALFFFSSIPY